jgi:hypothetical protein
LAQVLGEFTAVTELTLTAKITLLEYDGFDDLAKVIN